MPINQTSLQVNVRVNLSNTVNVSVPRASITNNSITTLKSQFAPASIDTLAELGDVITGSPQDGDLLVYDSSLNKYVIQQLESIDGGSF
jgi:hypothetical protein